MNPTPLRRKPSLRSREQGAAAVEFAIAVLVLLLPMFVATLEFGKVMYTYHMVVKATRDGARYLSAFDPRSTDYANRVTEARCLVVYGNTTCTAPTRDGGGLLGAGNVRISDSVTEVDTGCEGGGGDDDDAEGVTRVTLNASGNNTGAIKLVTVAVRNFSYPVEFPLIGVNRFNLGTICTTMRQGL